MSDNWPIVLIEGLLIFGATLAFAWWQLRDLRRERERTAQRRARLAATLDAAPLPSVSAPPATTSAAASMRPMHAAPDETAPSR